MIPLRGLGTSRWPTRGHVLQPPSVTGWCCVFVVEGGVQWVTASRVTSTFAVACCCCFVVGAKDAWGSSSYCCIWVKHEASQMCVVALGGFVLSLGRGVVVVYPCVASTTVGVYLFACCLRCLLFCSLFGLLSILLAGWSLPSLLVVVSCCRCHVCGGCLQLRPPVASG